MKHWALGLSAILTVAFTSCGDSKKQTATLPEADTTATASAAPEEAPAAAKESVAVCVWENISVRATASAKGKYVTALKLGETLTFLHATEKDGDHEYAKVRLQDGKEGWSRADFIVVDAKAAVFRNDSDLYSRPDLLTKTGDKFRRMDIVAIKQEKDGWVEIAGKRAEGKWISKGWVKPGNLTPEAVDIAAAKFASKAMKLDDYDKRLAALEEVAGNSDLSESVFIDLVKEEINNMKTTYDVDEVEDVPAEATEESTIEEEDADGE